jgi:hypothetical protein
VIRGLFDPWVGFGRAPSVNVLVTLPALPGLSGFISFLIDTGADTSAIHPRDMEKALGIDFDVVRAALPTASVERSLGIGGEAAYLVTTAHYAFVHEDGHWQEIVGQIRLAQSTTTNRRLPSIIGWDILERFRLTFDYPAGLVSLDSPEHR